MNQQTVRANLLLLVAAIIWGSTFVAQKIGMGAIGPFWFSRRSLYAIGTHAS